MKTRITGSAVLEKIRQVTEKDPAVELVRVQLIQDLFSKIDDGSLSSLEESQKEKIKQDVSKLRVFLLTELSKSQDDPDIYNALILLSQCFPENNRDDHNEVCAIQKWDKRIIKKENRFISSSGYWIWVPNPEYDSKRERISDFRYEYDNEPIRYGESFVMSKQDADRLNNLKNTWPRVFSERDSDDGMIPFGTLVGAAAGFMTFFGMFILTMAGGGILGVAGFPVVLLIVASLVVGGATGFSLATMGIRLSEYFTGKKAQEIPDFSHEENKINSLFYQNDNSKNDTNLMEAKKPFLSLRFKETLKKGIAAGLGIGGLLGAAAAITLLVVLGPVAFPFYIAVALYITVPAVMPFIFMGGSLLAHTVDYARDRFKRPAPPISEPIKDSATVDENKLLDDRKEPSPSPSPPALNSILTETFIDARRDDAITLKPKPKPSELSPDVEMVERKRRLSLSGLVERLGLLGGHSSSASENQSQEASNKKTEGHRK